MGPNGQKRLTKAAMESLGQYPWPGNVRELENVIERSVILSDGDEIDVRDLPERIVLGDAARSRLVIDHPDMSLDELEREYIFRVLEHTGGQKKRAAEILGINASTLYRKLQAYKAQGHLTGADEPEPEESEPEEGLDRAA
jgi:DNA-binding NtrC family response regulator